MSLVTRIAFRQPGIMATYHHCIYIYIHISHNCCFTVSTLDLNDTDPNDGMVIFDSDEGMYCSLSNSTHVVALRVVGPIPN